MFTWWQMWMSWMIYYMYIRSRSKKNCSIVQRCRYYYLNYYDCDCSRDCDRHVQGLWNRWGRVFRWPRRWRDDHPALVNRSAHTWSWQSIYIYIYRVKIWRFIIRMNINKYSWEISMPVTLPRRVVRVKRVIIYILLYGSQSM